MAEGDNDNDVKKRITDVLLSDILSEKPTRPIQKAEETTKPKEYTPLPAVIHIQAKKEEVTVEKEKELTPFQLEKRRELFRTRRMVQKIKARVTMESSPIVPTKVNPRSVRFVGLKDSGICLGMEPEDGFSVCITHTPVQFVPLPHRETLPPPLIVAKSKISNDGVVRVNSPSQNSGDASVVDRSNVYDMTPSFGVDQPREIYFGSPVGLDQSFMNSSPSPAPKQAGSGISDRTAPEQTTDAPRLRESGSRSTPRSKAKRASKASIAPLSREEALQAARNIWVNPEPARPEQPGLIRRNSVPQVY